MDSITASDLDRLQAAKRTLENPGLTAQLTDLMGSPIERGMRLLPEKAQTKIISATEKALMKVVSTAVLTLDANERGGSLDGFHQSMAIASGALGGALGLPGLLLELPVSTAVMMRSILDIARSHGEDLSSPETRLSALTVFAMGGRSRADDGSKNGYWIARAALARSISEAAQHLASRSAANAVAEAGAPAILRLIAQVASRFSIPVTQKVAAQAVPLVGAAGGAIVNSLFIQHFQEMAQGHFTIRQLERKYNPELIESAYVALLV